MIRTLLLLTLAVSSSNAITNLRTRSKLKDSPKSFVVSTNYEDEPTNEAESGSNAHVVSSTDKNGDGYVVVSRTEGQQHTHNIDSSSSDAPSGPESSDENCEDLLFSLTEALEKLQSDKELFAQKADDDQVYYYPGRDEDQDDGSIDTKIAKAEQELEDARARCEGATAGEEDDATAPEEDAEASGMEETTEEQAEVTENLEDSTGPEG